MKSLDIKDYQHFLKPYQNCTLCPRQCNVDRLAGAAGWCRSDAGFNIASICIHHGEEPIIGGEAGICNVFFDHCNLQCVFCQNDQISNNQLKHVARYNSLKAVVDGIIKCLDKGCKSVGFVSPTHYVPQVKMIIAALNELGRNPTIVYNTNAYDRVKTLRGLEDLVDVYLPDLKYMDAALANRYSRAKDYPEVAALAIREMYRQKGSSLITDEADVALRGILVRHLVLPGQVENSLAVLRFLAEEISTSIHISLMSQYAPMRAVQHYAALNRSITQQEYQQVLAAFDTLGFRNGFIQELASGGSYKPDFEREHPFEGR
jgi:putative pyruvate formate lyase activating enzyme